MPYLSKENIKWLIETIKENEITGCSCFDNQEEEDNIEEMIKWLKEKIKEQN